MYANSHLLAKPPASRSLFSSATGTQFTQNPSFRSFSSNSLPLISLNLTLSNRPKLMTADSNPSDRPYDVLQSAIDDTEIDRFAFIANKLADGAGEVVRKYFRKPFDILDKEDSSPVTIADRTAEECMVSILLEELPSHAMYVYDVILRDDTVISISASINPDCFGEENGWRCKENSAEYVWVLDPIDGTKSFITGKPVFGTLIALLRKGKPILGIIDQPVTGERWLGISGRRTTLNGKEVSSRNCRDISRAYLYTTSPHLFSGACEEAFARVRDKVKVPLYGCDCYAYALLASGFVDLVIESGLKPYDFLALVPVIEGSGGVITDWLGEELHWEASPEARPRGFNVVAAGDKELHQQALTLLQKQ